MKFNKLFIIGDVGGWNERFNEALQLAGVNMNTMEIPAGTAVLQVGDLTRIVPLFKENSGNKSCVNTALHLKTVNPQSYFQILGNHDIVYLNKAIIVRDETRTRYYNTVEDDVVDMLKHLSQLAPPYVTVDTPERQYIATHAGITRGAIERARRHTSYKYNQYIDRSEPITADDVETWKHFVNTMVTRNTSITPSLLETGYENMSADHFFADGVCEVGRSWDMGNKHDVKVHQIVGHSSPYDWYTKKWREGVSQEQSNNSNVDMSSLSVHSTVNGVHVIYTDPIWRNTYDPNRKQQSLTTLTNVNING